MANRAYLHEYEHSLSLEVLKEERVLILNLFMAGVSEIGSVHLIVLKAERRF